MQSKIDDYIGKAKQWKNEIITLREIVMETNLDETLKWNKPCYCHKGKNIAIIQPFKHALGFMFFKGSLLQDPYKVLIDNGPYSRSARRLEFRSEKEINRSRSIIRKYIKESIQLEINGIKIPPNNHNVGMIDELKTAFCINPELKQAFLKLTPGRQRGWILYFNSAKQSSTRKNRIEKALPEILKGKGFHER